MANKKKSSQISKSLIITAQDNAIMTNNIKATINIINGIENVSYVEKSIKEFRAY